jgi:serine/threonine protein kinase
MVGRSGTGSEASFGYTHLAQGSVFGGDFQIQRLLGQGGMGAVYLAHQRSTNMPRALKIMHPDLLRDPVLRARFAQEARIGSLVQSEHVVEVVTAGVDQGSEIPYIVMEYLEGEDLDAVLHRRGPLPLGEVRVIFEQLCHGLAMAHAVGIVHRDLKPENVFVARSRRADVPYTIKILDFGIAKLIAAAMGTGRVTQAIGTPLYMAPEQAVATAVPTPAADVWALGLLAFTVITGKNYWTSAAVGSASIHAVLAEVLQGPLPAASQRLVEMGTSAPLPPGFDGWFAGCVNREPGQRFRHAGAAWAALAQIVDAVLGQPRGSLSPSMTPVPVAATPTPSPMTPAPGAATPTPGASTPVPHQGYPRGGTEPGWSSVPGGSAPPTPGYAAAPAVTGVGVGTGVAFGRTAAGPSVGPNAQRARSSSVAGPLSIVGGALAVIGLGVGLAIWAVPKTAYCISTAEQQGVVRCTREVDPATVAHREGTLRVTRARGRVVREENIDGFGNPTPDDDGTVASTFEYAGGRLALQTAIGRHGRVLYKLRYSNDGRHFDVLGPDDQIHAYPNTSVAKVDLEHDTRGFVTKLRFFSKSGTPATNSSAAFGYQRAHDETGSVVEQVVLGPDGNPWFDANNEQRVIVTHDARGETTALTYTTMDGRPHLHKEGYQRAEFVLDERGNTTKATYFGIDKRPTVLSSGFAGWAKQYDDHGFMTELRFLGPDGAPASRKDGVQVIRFVPDANGRRAETHFLDSDGSPGLDDDGIAGWSTTYNEEGDPLRTVYLGGDGKPTPNDDYCSIVEKGYDARGNRAEWRCLDEDGKPRNGSSGYASSRIVFDSLDRATEFRYFDPSGKPVLRKGGYAMERHAHDASGNIVQEDFFDTSEQPVRGSSWYATVKRRFDDRGNQLEAAYFDISGTPTRSNEGYAVVKTTYSDWNLVTGRAYFNPDGKPTWSKQRVAIELFKHDALGRTIEASYRDTEGRPSPNKDGDITVKSVYDDRGRVIERHYLDASGAPTVQASKGYAIVRTVYDAVDRIVEESYYDASDKPVAIGSGYAMQRNEYDSRGNRITELYFDAAGAPLPASKGAAAMRRKFDVRGYPIEWAFFDPSGRPYKTTKGYALSRRTNDAFGHPTEWKYFGETGAPVGYDGCFVARSRYDDLERDIESSCFDSGGRPAPASTSGVPVMRFTYDARGWKIDEEYLDGSGARVADKRGVGKEVYHYDDRGNETERIELDVSGAPAKGYLNLSRVFDDRGNVTRAALLDAGGNPATNTDGYSVQTILWNERDQPIEEAYFDAHGKPVMNRNRKAAVIRMTYGENGERRETQNLDVSGALIRKL